MPSPPSASFLHFQLAPPTLDVDVDVDGMVSTVTDAALRGSLDPTTGIFYDSPERARVRRTPLACDRCRVRKAKCSGDHPVCARCRTKDLPCHYTGHAPRRQRSAAARGASDARVKETETHGRVDREASSRTTGRRPSHPACALGAPSDPVSAERSELPLDDGGPCVPDQPPASIAPEDAGPSMAYAYQNPGPLHRMDDVGTPPTGIGPFTFAFDPVLYAADPNPDPDPDPPPALAFFAPAFAPELPRVAHAQYAPACFSPSLTGGVQYGAPCPPSFPSYRPRSHGSFDSLDGESPVQSPATPMPAWTRGPYTASPPGHVYTTRTYPPPQTDARTPARCKDRWPTGAFGGHTGMGVLFDGAF